MRMRSLFNAFQVLLIGYLLLMASMDHAKAEPQSPPDADLWYEGWMKRAKRKIEDPVTKWRYHWKDGIYFKGDFAFRILY